MKNDTTRVRGTGAPGPIGPAADLPPWEEMLTALFDRDASYDGLFFAAVTTTGIFCRPSCPARNPKPEHVEFYATARGALFAGFRPCRRCHPLEEPGRTPSWATQLIARVEAWPDERIRDADLRADGLDPVAVRRYFQKTYGMTFQAYSRSRRLGHAFAALRAGSSLDEAVFSHGWESHSGFRSAFGKAAGLTPGRVAPRRPTPGRLAPGEAGASDFIRLAWIETPLGPMVAGATERALCLLEFTDRRMIEAQLETVRRRFGLPLLAGESPVFPRLREELAEYFAGGRRDFDLPLDYRGSEFQQRVWEGLLRIPYGETRSYAELAGDLGASGAARAVGRANGLNRIAILVPCHRVIAADGGLGGYGGGLWRKLRLLETEGSAPVGGRG
jgi:AraC family transcriptional regulator, regulatory protein of adaptative response / methylated-DNA-[protein]-cysteine methyltransferase